MHEGHVDPSPGSTAVLVAFPWPLIRLRWQRYLTYATYLTCKPRSCRRCSLSAHGRIIGEHYCGLRIGGYAQSYYRSDLDSPPDKATIFVAGKTPLGRTPSYADHPWLEDGFFLLSSLRLLLGLLGDDDRVSPTDFHPGRSQQGTDGLGISPLLAD